jgi:hypothetical protein
MLAAAAAAVFLLDGDELITVELLVLVVVDLMVDL